MRYVENRRWLEITASLLAGILLTACTSMSGKPSTPEATSSSIAGPDTGAGSIDDLSPEARPSDGGGDPRPPAYWALWNTCASGNRAAEAEANGGAAAGFYLVDDILADPGVGLGDHVLTTCEESVAILEGRTGTGSETNDPAFALAAQLLAAELSLNVGAETCPEAEEAVVSAQIVLAAAQFDGVSTSPLDAEVTGALPRLIDMLAAYNSGDLCR